MFIIDLIEMLRSVAIAKRVTKNVNIWNKLNNMISFKFINKDESITEVNAEAGQTILEVAKQNDIDLEGACEASCACSTCHVIFEQQLYDSLPEPEEEEDDMLDLAFALTMTSRLGCQIKVDSSFESAIIRLPKATRNMYVD